MLVAQLCPTLYNPMDCSLPDSSVHGLLQARILEREPFPSPGDLPNPGVEPGSPVLWADSLLSEPPGNHPYVSICTLFFGFPFHVGCHQVPIPPNLLRNVRPREGRGPPQGHRENQCQADMSLLVSQPALCPLKHQKGAPTGLQREFYS